MRRWYIAFCLILIFGVGGAAAMLYVKDRQATEDDDTKGKPAPAAPLQEQPAAAPPSIIRLVATGDMIAHESINQNAKKSDGSYDYTALMTDMKPFFAKSDIRFCNQATPAGGSQFGISGYPTFNAPIEFARGIEGVGCNLINLGTNHTNDKGQKLIDATVTAWDNRQGIVVAGANRSAQEQNKTRVFTIKDMKFAFVSYTTYTNKPVSNNYGVNMYSDALAKKQIADARKQADFVIVSMRWGTEYSAGVNGQQNQLAQKLADFGADVILGHGPHVLEPVKRLKASDKRDVLVWFSLGNFMNSQIDIESLIGGFAVMDIDNATKKVTSIGFMPVYQHYEWTAAQKQRAGAADLAARRNFKMIPLDMAKELLAKSQHNTTIEAQAARIKSVLSKFTQVPIIASKDF